MIDIIIALLMMLGINIEKEYVTVVSERTGEVYGVGNTVSNGGNSIYEPKSYILCLDNNGNYYLVAK